MLIGAVPLRHPTCVPPAQKACRAYIFHSRASCRGKRLPQDMQQHSWILVFDGSQTVSNVLDLQLTAGSTRRQLRSGCRRSSGPDERGRRHSGVMVLSSLLGRCWWFRKQPEILREFEHFGLENLRSPVRCQMRRRVLFPFLVNRGSSREASCEHEEPIPQKTTNHGIGKLTFFMIMG